MNNEQNTPGKASEAEQESSKVFLGDSTLQSQEEFESDKAKSDQDYYSVDDPKKEISTNIGDGEMRNEGLVGEGSIPDENILSNGGFTDDQDKAELRDTEA